MLYWMSDIWIIFRKILMALLYYTEIQWALIGGGSSVRFHYYYAFHDQGLPYPHNERYVYAILDE